ncbi:MAG: glycosyltransferase [Thermoanaerobaculia bacterium]
MLERPLRIAYFLADTDLSGGVRVVLAHADGLIARGHEVTIFTPGLPLSWIRSRAEWKYVDDFDTIDASSFDFVIGTFWTTVRSAWNVAHERAIHLCQGYEGAFTAYQEIRGEIDAVYALPIPKLVVSPHLIEVCRRFTPRVFWIGQVVDQSFYRSGRGTEHEPLRVLLAGASQIDFKGVDVGYGAALHARAQGGVFDLVRVSPWAPSNEEPVREHVAEFHVALDAEAMTRLVHSCDLFLGPSRHEEGFGLPAVEAMAAALPVVLTRIPSFLAFDERKDFALWAGEDDAVGLGDQLFDLLMDEELRRKLGRRGREVAEKFRLEKVSEVLEGTLLELRGEGDSTRR